MTRKPEIRVAQIGYQFMGRAHSNAWRQAGHFFDLPARPILQVVCGRNDAAVAQAADRLGFAEYATSWQQVVARDDIDVVDICTPGDSHPALAGNTSDLFTMLGDGCSGGGGGGGGGGGSGRSVSVGGSE